ncbi:hypothetical protein VTN77DRAFT_7601 [Rasamsonia byssochlamydoides]|uniref:uncharacterized protein n=1 Tax=Rasamsonia byssochlamydoides TaxID=89139 RepID=UPI00374431D3
MRETTVDDSETAAECISQMHLAGVLIRLNMLCQRFKKLMLFQRNQNKHYNAYLRWITFQYAETWISNIGVHGDTVQYIVEVLDWTSDSPKIDL